jgi:hypothetical protein
MARWHDHKQSSSWPCLGILEQCGEVRQVSRPLTTTTGNKSPAHMHSEPQFTSSVQPPSLSLVSLSSRTALGRSQALQLTLNAHVHLSCRYRRRSSTLSATFLVLPDRGIFSGQESKRGLEGHHCHGRGLRRPLMAHRCDLRVDFHDFGNRGMAEPVWGLDPGIVVGRWSLGNTKMRSCADHISMRCPSCASTSHVLFFHSVFPSFIFDRTYHGCSSE